MFPLFTHPFPTKMLETSKKVFYVRNDFSTVQWNKFALHYMH